MGRGRAGIHRAGRRHPESLWQRLAHQPPAVVEAGVWDELQGLRTLLAKTPIIEVDSAADGSEVWDGDTRVF